MSRSSRCRRLGPTRSIPTPALAAGLTTATTSSPRRSTPAGSAVGVRYARACESAIERGSPLLTVSASGGARMQEGILSLMQLPKTVCALDELHEAGLPMFSVLTHPTTGGVMASFASLGDVTIAEPGALLAFTGPRVVQSIVKEKLSEDFGRAEQNLRFGHLDAILPRSEQR